MGNKVIYRSGLELKGVYCSRCKQRTDGTVMQNRFRWTVYAKCGHLLQKGTVLPPEVLEQLRLVNQKQPEDPRWRARIDFKAAERRKEEIEQVDYKLSALDRTRERYL